jgi:hypothetical protein
MSHSRRTLDALQDPGPPVMTREELVGPFTRGEHPLFCLLGDVQPGRFDKTEAYGDLPPLCLVAVFQKC